MKATNAIIPSTCWECSAHCGSLVTVEDGRVTRVSPYPEHPASLGAFCVKGIRGLPELTYHPDRVLYPMKRTGPRGGGRWQRVSWDEALDEMAGAMLAVRERYGPTALCGAVSNAHFSRGVMLALLLRAFGSPNWMMNQDLCGGCRALSDRITGLAISKGEDIDNTRCALVVGRNPYAADPPQWQALKRAKAKGASVVVIDPGETPAATMADLWLRPRPGTDAAIGLAMIHWLVKHGRYDRNFVERWCHGFDALVERAAQYPAERAAELTGVAAGGHREGRGDVRRRPFLFRERGTASTPSAPGSRPSARFIASSPSAATWTARAATGASRSRPGSPTTSRCCTSPSSGCPWRWRIRPSAQTGSRCGLDPMVGRRRATTRR